ncbi:hypothetical protein HHI36_013274 [Cryptolaemus montrouzieri]|uniref:Uncharacterized protein n=1 Tax=Cryptolaemus montrouzieri TaxID=559131 RepID=A0ABD2NH22_9CUCU
MQAITAVNGLEKCKIRSYNSSVFSKTDFVPSLIKDIPQIERELISEVTTATSNIRLARSAVAPLFNSQVLPPTVTEAQPINITEPNCLEVIPLATSTTTISSSKPGCCSWFDNTEMNKTPGTTQKSRFSLTTPQQIML